ncbi:hypothetical protein ACQ4PT_054647 [Festuca glaucescens]
MASSLLTTDKRWAAPTRKSGMTVLGKIPKPINLPSQRLENQGLDPNVEIVPKGTHTWGSKPGPTTPNAWNSSSLLSPKKDGSVGAPSQFNGRPSSGEVQDPRRLEVNPLTLPMLGVQTLDRLQHLAHYRHNIYQWSQIVLEVQRQDQEAHNFLGLRIIPQSI